MTKRELAELKRAIRDSDSRKPKTQQQHDEDVDWLDWAIDKAKKYGPQLAQLLAEVL